MSVDFFEYAVAIVDETWLPLFNRLKPELLRINSQLNDVVTVESLTPRPEEIFAAFSLPIHQVRVVILGQDPYPTSGVAVGRAFAVRHDAVRPPSLKNIYQEVGQEYDCVPTFDQELWHWQDQGVLLLNTALTLNTSRAQQGHFAMWQMFIEAVFNEVASQPQHQVWMLWGNKAADYKNFATGKSVLKTSHPSPLSAYRGFLGSGIFRLANADLVAHGSPAIDWVS